MMVCRLRCPSRSFRPLTDDEQARRHPTELEEIEHMKLKATSLVAATFATCACAATSHATGDSQSKLKSMVDSEIRPVMAKDGIPGMAVALTIAGKPYVFDYGVASMESHQPVTRDTMFELGSVTKTFTATLTAYAQVQGNLSLTDKVSKHLPSLHGSKFGEVSLLNLGTHTPGGLPLQVPDAIANDAQLMQYFREWRPAYPPGTYRTYSNPGIGTLGLITAKSMGQDFIPLTQNWLFPALGLTSSYIDVPAARMPDYAHGYTKDNAPIRMATGELSSEAYGIKTTASDLIRFVEANMDLVQLDPQVQRAIEETHTGYFKAGAMTQDLIWEQYPYPVALQTLLDGNSSAMSLNATPVSEIKPPQKPEEDAWINKTGSTNGFGTYVAFVPRKHLGIVILANKNYPNGERVSIAYKILTSLANDKQ
jgi:beta-lactamase class C